LDSTTLELLQNSKQRYRFYANIYNIHNKVLERVTVLLDTGCYNTMIPKEFAADYTGEFASDFGELIFAGDGWGEM